METSLFRLEDHNVRRWFIEFVKTLLVLYREQKAKIRTWKLKNHARAEVDDVREIDTNCYKGVLYHKIEVAKHGFL